MRALLVALTPEAGRNVSRAHLEIDRSDTGYVLVDRASTCGTIVEGEIVGGATRGGTIALRDGDVILVGTSRTPYVFRFRVEARPE